MTKPPLDQDAYYRGIPTVPYDLVKEFVLALVGSGIIIVVLALALSSPDVPPLTIQTWAQQDPVDFVTTATSELAGTSFSAAYGPPYTDGSDSVQAIGPFAPQAWLGNAVHLDTAHDFVLGPLGDASVGNAGLAAALQTYNAADATTQQGWLTAYTTALANATAQDGEVASRLAITGRCRCSWPISSVSPGRAASTGCSLRAAISSRPTTRSPCCSWATAPTLPASPTNQHLLGSQWGMMNETGSYPGQAWLWLYSMWYQIPPYNTAPNADLLVVLTMGILTLLLAFVPFIPILRDIPRWIPIHRLVWRDYYRWRRRHPSPEAT